MVVEYTVSCMCFDLDICKLGMLMVVSSPE